MNEWLWLPLIVLSCSYTVCPNKRKTVLSGGYLHCHARCNQTIYMHHYPGPFLFFHFDTKHMMISKCMTEKEQFKLIHVKIDLRRILVMN